MERKTLLAIILSVIVLFSYETIFVAPKRAQALKEKKVTATEQVTQKPAPQSAPAISANNEIQPQTTKGSFSVKEWDFSTKKLHSKISNVGGSLQNIKISPKYPSPLTDVLAIKGVEQAEFKLVSQEDNKTVLSYTNDDWKVVKTVQSVDDYLTTVRMEISPLKTMSNLKEWEFILFNIVPIEGKDHAEASLDEYSVYSDGKIVRKGSAFKFNTTKEDKIQAGEVKWAAFREHFTAIVIRPEFKTKAFEINALTEKSLEINVRSEAASGVAVYDFSIYTGPQDTRLMKKYGKEFEKAVAFSNFWLLDIIAMAIYHTIPVVHAICRSWGFTIILISILIYGLTYPLTAKSMASMRKMQLMQPKIKALQDRYKNDPQKLNAEIMDIYRREKINPLGGCLPFLLQMPIFIALYQVLWRSFYFQGKGFLWINDLAQPDRLFIMPFSLPFLGNEFNILPILMAGVMFAQQKISSKNMVVTDEQQVMQQKMMMYFFPVFIGFIFYKFASGLSLYFTVFYLLSTLAQWKMNQNGNTAK